MFPAPAGINRTQPRFPASPLRVPRASGDKPAKKYGWMRQKKCSRASGDKPEKKLLS
ncbi:hypothetical protein CJ908_001288 [Escherichia coli]|nr:hypothetical protein [Escherichia coli]HAV9118071.1 hypothetical protein [Escherichia coli]HAY0625236.1 hypothetical protein [Escherichia coli]